jgi:hypothetical protein
MLAQGAIAFGGSRADSHAPGFVIDIIREERVHL